MKKWGILAIIVVVILLGIIAGVVIGSGNTSDSNPSGPKTLAEQNIPIEKTQENKTNVTVVSTSVTEIKTTPNTELQLKRSYLDCGHTRIDKMDMPAELVNLSEKEFQTQYGDDWEIEKFETGEVILSKREVGICKEHYVLREKEGYIAIYTIDKLGQETLQETTGIALQYLPELDVEKIKQGIKISGKQALSAELENYE